MIRVSNIKVHVKDDCISTWKKKITKKLNINYNDLLDIIIFKKSIDARKKPEIFYIYTFDCNIKNEQVILRKHPQMKVDDKVDLEIKRYKGNISPIIIGAGPSGLFCALVLARAGANPIIIERGKSVEDRSDDVKKFFETNILNVDSNVQYGEGGAGTFSDGKLNSSVKDYRNRFVLQTFVDFGANEEILFANKPHIGTDVLINVIKNMRSEIESLGGKFYFNTRMKDFKLASNIEVYTSTGDRFNTDRLVLAIGNSAREEFIMLKDKGMEVVPKSFAVGYRVSHSQEMINKSNYGEKYCDLLGACDYKLTYTTKNKIPVYSFCMCPGGYVVNSSSEQGQIVVNGMSYSKRNSKTANSAIIMGVSFDTVEDAIKFQIEIEKRAFVFGQGAMPTMLYGDYKKNIPSTKFGEVKPRFKGKYRLCNIRGILSYEYEQAFIEAMEEFSKKIEGFNRDDTIITAIESRTSSPVRIVRYDNFQSNFKKVYPIGEGAGYAGGIMSASIDGIKVAQSILEEE